MAQPPGWDHLGTESGLLSEEVYKVFQDQQGYLWALTDFGPQKHNGRFFEKAPGFPPSFPTIYNYHIDRQKNLWFYNAKGQIGQYYNDTFRVHPISPELIKGTTGQNSLVYKMEDGESGSLYFNCFGGLLKWDFGMKLDSVFRPKNLNWHLFKQDGIWLAKRFPIIQKLAFFKPNFPQKIKIQVEGFGRKTIEIELPYKELNLYRMMASERKNDLLITVGQWAILVLKDGSYTLRRFENAIVFNKIIDGEYYLGFYNDGLARLEPDLKKPYFLLEEVSVSDAIRDNQGFLWVSTLEKGIFREKERDINGWKSISDKITMIKPLNQELFIGTENGEMFSIDTFGNPQKIPLPSMKSARVVDITQKDGNLWIGSLSGVFKWEGKQGFTRLKDSLTGNEQIGLYFAKTAENKFFISHIRGLMEIKPQHSVYRIKTPFKTRELLFWKNKLWLASEDGIHSYFVDSRQLRESHVLFPETRILAMKLHNNRLWASVFGSGMCSINPDGKIEFSKALPASVPVMDFCFGEKEDLILATLSGVFWHDTQSGKTEKISEMATLKTTFWNRKLWLGTKIGLFSMDWPYQKNTANAPFYLADFYENGKKSDFRNRMSLASLNQNLEFHFDVLDYSKENASLGFELMGPKSLKGNSSGHILKLNELPPGDYRLLVKSLESSSKSHATEFAFSIAPAWFQTWWFRLIAGVLTLMFLLASIRFTLAYYRRKDAAANRLQQMLAGYKITALQSQMNPHFVSNALTAIQNLILTKKLDEANGYLTKFSRLLRMVLELSAKPFIPLEKELQVLKYNVELEQLRFQQKFDFELVTGPELDLSQIFIPTLIIQPFVENAIWHGLLPLQEKRKGKLHLRIRSTGNLLKIELEDNGVGRKQSEFQTKEQASFGQDLTQSRLDNLNKLLNEPVCKLHIQDLMDDQGESAGTRIELTFPLNLHEIKDQSLFAGR